MCASNWERQLQTIACTRETEKSWLSRDNRTECSFRNQSCNPVCKKIKNESIGLNSSESQEPNTIQHPRHLFPKEAQGSLSQAIQLPSHPGMNTPSCVQVQWQSSREQFTLHTACVCLKTHRLQWKWTFDPSWWAQMNPREYTSLKSLLTA